jgi:hypothetical protein
MVTTLAVNIMDGEKVVAYREINFLDSPPDPLPFVGDLIAISVEGTVFRGKVSDRDFDYTQFQEGNDDPAFVLTVWADVQ